MSKRVDLGMSEKNKSSQSYTHHFLSLSLSPSLPLSLPFSLCLSLSLSLSPFSILPSLHIYPPSLILYISLSLILFLLSFYISSSTHTISHSLSLSFFLSNPVSHFSLIPFKTLSLSCSLSLSTTLSLSPLLFLFLSLSLSLSLSLLIRAMFLRQPMTLDRNMAEHGGTWPALLSLQLQLFVYLLDSPCKIAHQIMAHLTVTRQG